MLGAGCWRLEAGGCWAGCWVLAGVAKCWVLPNAGRGAMGAGGLGAFVCFDLLCFVFALLCFAQLCCRSINIRSTSPSTSASPPVLPPHPPCLPQPPHAPSHLPPPLPSLHPSLQTPLTVPFVPQPRLTPGPLQPSLRPALTHFEHGMHAKTCAGRRSTCLAGHYCQGPRSRKLWAVSSGGGLSLPAELATTATVGLAAPAPLPGWHPPPLSGWQPPRPEEDAEQESGSSASAAAREP